MSELVIKLGDASTAQSVVAALESHKARLKASIGRTKGRLTEFEQKYAVDTDYFLHEMTAEDLEGGDLEYVEWAGEAKLLEGLEKELTELETAHNKNLQE